MTIRMLIDARHREETRVAVVNGNRIEEFDFESAERKQLKGNIYLAKVTRVEPSLQAAFIDYGGNRHGFLAFSEIHPDYYQIPREDREALLREEAEHAAEEERRHGDDDDDHDDDPAEPEHGAADDARDDVDEANESEGEGEGEAPRPEAVNGAGSDDHAVESLRQRRTNLRHRYKIQDVIRRRQVLLVQVVKEERGNKGAALTTYLSLAGRYCVLMPNTSHGGGISRKISSPADRKRLKSILGELDLPKSMGCIVRTAGLQRTKSEIRRDFDYLARLWDEIRATTLASSAPALVYGDNDLIKRAIRDIYNKDIEEIIVEGEDGYRQARQFMKLLMPSHVKRLHHYADAVPLFQRGGVEDQLAAMYQPVVQLKSGGYLVINPTEALVSIDINSGRSTREHNIEQTALMTNLEASHEIARQLRLRDMAGLVVIDFIDMENNSNNRKVEKAMKEALRNDRARIQVGRISSFGLFEMSRQRLRTGVLEASTRVCPHCEGTGLVRTASSAGISALRMLEEEAARGRGSRLLLRCSTEAAFYVLNRKRADIAEIEDRYGVMIEVLPDGSLEGARMTVEAGGPPPAQPPRMPAPLVDMDEDPIVDEEEDVEDDEEEDAEPIELDADGREMPETSESRAAREDGGRRRRRRRRRGGRREEGDAGAGEALSGETGDVRADAEADGDADAGAEPGEEIAANADLAVGDTSDAADAGEGRRRRGRRGRRGGRAAEGREVAPAEPASDADEAYASSAASDDVVAETEAQVADDAVIAAVALESAAPVAAEAVATEAVATPEPATDEALAPAPRPRRRPRARAAEGDAAPGASIAGAEAADDAVAPRPARGRRRKADAPIEADTPSADAPIAGDGPVMGDGPIAGDVPLAGMAPVAEDGPVPPVSPEAQPEAVTADDGEAAAIAKPRRARRRKADDAPAAEPELALPVEMPPADEAPAPAPLADAPAAAIDEAADEPTELEPTASGDDAAASDAAPARRGWWQRTFGN